MSVKDRLPDIPISPTATVEFIAGMCEALSDHTGRVYAEIGGFKGKLVAKFRREPFQAGSSIPTFIRKAD